MSLLHTIPKEKPDIRYSGIIIGDYVWFEQDTVCRYCEMSITYEGDQGAIRTISLTNKHTCARRILGSVGWGRTYYCECEQCGGSILHYFFASEYIDDEPILCMPCLESRCPEIPVL